MSVDATGDVIILAGDCHVEDAEGLTTALLERPRPIDIGGCRHLHAAVAQTLLSFCATVIGEPDDAFLRDFVVPALRRGAAGGRNAL